MILDQIRCVVLNATYEPITISSAKKAFLLVYEGKATVLKTHPSAKVRTVTREIAIPIQVLMNYVVKARPTYRSPAQLNNKNLFIRDRYKCVYCGRHKSELRDGERLTRDHVHPQSLGGSDTWDNVVTACSKCNNKKADYKLSDLNWKLPFKPYVPTIFEVWSKTDTRRDKSFDEQLEYN